MPARKSPLDVRRYREVTLTGRRLTHRPIVDADRYHALFADFGMIFGAADSGTCAKQSLRHVRRPALAATVNIIAIIHGRMKK